MRGLVAAAVLWAAAGCADPFIEATTRVGDTSDVVGPYSVRAVVVGVASGDRVELRFNVIDGEPENFIPVLMDEVDLGADDGTTRGELFRQGIPGQPAGTEILYYVAVTRDGEVVAEDPVGGDLRPFLFQVRELSDP